MGKVTMYKSMYFHHNMFLKTYQTMTFTHIIIHCLGPNSDLVFG